MAKARAIETYYQGTWFRSRLEAQWAFFLTEMGLQWTYEPQGYVGEDGRAYLPDFFLPKLDVYLEIKPTEPDWSNQPKCWAVAEATGMDVFILWGKPADYYLDSAKGGCQGLFPVKRIPAWSDGGPEVLPEEEQEGPLYSEERWWAHCPACGATGIVLYGATEKLNCCGDNPGHSLAAVSDDVLRQAMLKASNHRFGRVA